MGEKRKIKYSVAPNTTITVTVYVDVSNPDLPRVLTAEEEKKLDKEKLPENIVAEWSKWAKPTWGIHSWIDEQSYFKKSLDPRAGKEFDIMRFMRARVRALLVDWSLSESDPSLKLTTITEALSDGTPVNFLNAASLMAVASCNPDVVNSFYSKAVEALYPTSEDEKN